MFALSYCAIGIALILMSMRQCDIWRRAHHLHIFEILDKHLSEGKELRPPTVWDLLFNKSELEFRICRDIFYDMYKIQKKSLAFDLYAEHMFDRFVIFIIQIRPFDRLLLCLVLLLNMGRAMLNLTLADCDSSEDEEAYIKCADTESIILFTIVGGVFFVVTCLLAVQARRIEIAILHRNGISSTAQYVFFLENMETEFTSVEGVLVDPVEERRINKESLKIAAIDALFEARKKKLNGSFSYFRKFFPSLFQSIESDLEIFDKMTNRISYSCGVNRSTPVTTKKPRLGSNHSDDGWGSGRHEFASPSNSNKDNHAKHDSLMLFEQHSDKLITETTRLQSNNGELPNISWKSHDCQLKLESVEDGTSSSGKELLAGQHDDADDVRSQRTKTTESSSRRSFLHSERPIGNTHGGSNRHSQIYPIVESSLKLEVNFNDSESSRLQPSPGGSDQDGDEMPHLLSPQSRKDGTKDMFVRPKSLSARNLDITLYNELSTVFPFSNPELFFETVHALIMLISFYLSLYLTSFISSTADWHWKLLSLLPGVLGVAIFICLVRTVALIFAIYKVNFEAVLEVQEQTDNAEQLVVLVRHTIQMKLREMAGISMGNASILHPADEDERLQLHLEELFAEIDTSKDGKLSQSEFVSFLKALNIHMSRKKWIQVV